MQFDLHGERANAVIRLLLHFQVPAMFLSGHRMLLWLPGNQKQQQNPGFTGNSFTISPPETVLKNTLCNFLIFTSPRDEAQNAF